MKSKEEIYEIIKKFNNDSNVIKLKNSYSKKSFMDILGVSRKEGAHSNFLAWLFDANNNFELGNTPLKLFLELLVSNDLGKHIPKSLLDENILIRNVDIKDISVEREKVISNVNKKDGLIDLVINFRIDENKYMIILENKIKSKENRKSNGESQTKKYYEYYKDTNNCIFVFLSPEYKGGILVNPDSDFFISISYGMLVDYIIEPLAFNYANNNLTKLYLEEYLSILYKPNIDDIKESDIVIAIPKYEKAVLNTIANNHSDMKELLLNKNNFSDELADLISVFEDNNNIVMAIWPELQKSKCRNRTFAELGIKKGSILYLAKHSESDEYEENIRVRTIDVKNQVEFLDNDYPPTSISNAAGILRETNSLNGFKYFVYNGKNLFNMKR